MLTLRQSRNFAFRILVPLIAVLLALLCSPWGEDSFFHCFALFASYFMLEMCLWVMYADIAQTYRVSDFVVFGFGHGLLSTGSLAGFLTLQPGGLLANVAFNDMALVLVGLVSFTLGVAVLPNAAEIRSTLIRGSSCPVFVDDIDELTGVVPRGLGDVVRQQAVGSEGTGAEVGADLGKPSSVPAASVEAEGSSVTGEDPLSSSAATADTARAVSAEAMAEQQAQQLGRFKRKCAAVADTFLLSRKETEVLFLLAKGRNSAAIQESLYISAGTANTHMRHIYRKLDVHSQHELIELVESMTVE